jgi:soluble lytic murein transglycosylase-like protein
MKHNKNFLATLAILLVISLMKPAWCVAFCFEEAGKAFDIDPAVLEAIAKVESNFNPAAVNYNRNGTYDFGLMQINSTWYKVLGEKIWMRLGNPCVNVYVSAWILRQCLDRHGNIEDALACYNAGNRLKAGRAYARKVMREIKRDRE